MDQVRRVNETLKRLKKTAEVKVYKGAGHAFFRSDRASYMTRVPSRTPGTPCALGWVSN